jgi:transposase-like protein
MKRSIYQIKKLEQLKKQAVQLYKQGYTLRQVGQLIGRSHQWVALVLKEKNVKY